MGKKVATYDIIEKCWIWATVQRYERDEGLYLLTVNRTGNTRRAHWSSLSLRRSERSNAANNGGVEARREERNYLRPPPPIKDETCVSDEHSRALVESMAIRLRGKVYERTKRLA